MKYLKILSILLFSSFVFFISCKEKTETPKTKEEIKNPLKVFDTPAQKNTSIQTAASVFHYTCNNGCAGGAAANGNCSSCGSPLTHNQAYHKNDNKTPPSSPINTPTTPPTPEPSQNAAGVWHYTCASGCAGGSGSASNCGSCGNKLAHNTAYHQ